MNDTINHFENDLAANQEDLWRVFRIMAEFVEGFEKMSNIKPSVAVFGSARTKPSNKCYKMTVKVSKELAKRFWNYYWW